MFAPGTGRPGLVLGFGGFSNAQMKAAAQRLAAVIAEVMKARKRRHGALRKASS
jgi:GntR family transcriptional regulator/MocR family aminotransferase